MSMDWFIKWPKIKEYEDAWTKDFMTPPTAEVIKEVMEDYFSGLYMVIEERQPGFLVMLLKGTKTSMFRRHGGISHDRMDGAANSERYIEVTVKKKEMIVTTRLQDDVTIGLAADFARRCAQRWDGEIDEPS